MLVVVTNRIYHMKLPVLFTNSFHKMFAPRRTESAPVVFPSSLESMISDVEKCLITVPNKNRNAAYIIFLVQAAFLIRPLGELAQSNHINIYARRQTSSTQSRVACSLIRFFTTLTSIDTSTKNFPPPY